MTPDADLFADALERPFAEREDYVATACGADVAQRERVLGLLLAHEKANEKMSAPFIRRPPEPLFTETGTVIGCYKLLEKIGEGGCGVVWMAQQEEPVRRRVALKIIKLGLDTKEVIARFEAERQALAMMEHPHIAKVLDAGATAAGRPYFVMELVRGQPITRYCDERNIPTAKRLALFVQVCRAIQHAHEKGVVHRDIKPSNILVTHEDGAPLPKVIDFGIAKATQGRLTDKTLFTAFEQFIGTPAYMSPEQADFNAHDVDARSDVYSLGALLYELIVGRAPFDPKTLTSQGVDEVRRILREVDPPRPSTQLNTLPEGERTLLAQRHGLRPAEHAVAVRGDIDWIVMKALEKNRARRYETAEALAADVQRQLRHEPVLARPPSLHYRAQKLLRRHRPTAVAAGLLLGALTLGAGASVWQARRAARAEDEYARLVAGQQNQIVNSYAVGANPYGAAFDGEHIWVCNQGAGTVTKLRASTGALIGTYPVGLLPFGALSEGTHLWVANQGSHTLTKLRPDTGAVLGTYPSGQGPTGLAFDGTHIWVGNFGANTVTKLSASTGAIVATIPAHSARGVAFDGTHIWVADHSGGGVTKIHAATGEVVGFHPTGTGAYAVLFDGTHLWVSNVFASSLTKLVARTGAVVGTYDVGTNPRGFAFDGENLWVANGHSNTVTVVDGRTGSVVRNYATGIGPFGVAFDGSHIWVVNQGSASVTRY